MNRRGYLGDVGFIIAVLMAVVLIFIIGAKVFGDVNEEFQDSNQLDNNSKQLIGGLEARYIGLFDGVLAFAFGLLAVGLIISVAMLGSRPEFFFITVIVGFFIVGAATILGNFFDSFANGQLATTATQFTYIPLIMGNLLEITLFLVAILIVGLFVKARGVV